MSEQHPPVREPETDEEEPGLRDHVEDVADGCGCTEVWEHLGARESGGEAEANADD